MTLRRFVRRSLGTCALLSTLLLPAGSSSAQTPSVTVEYRPPANEKNESTADATAGRALTLAFRVINRADLPQSAVTRVQVPADWQLLFAGDRVELAPRESIVDTITVVAPRTTHAGDYTVRYAVSPSNSASPATAAATVRIRERRALAITWLTNPTYLAAGTTATAELVVANEGNVAERVTLDVRSVAGSVIRPVWTNGMISAGDQQHVRVEIRPPSKAAKALRETLTARAAAASASETYEAGLQFEIVPAGRTLQPARKELPTSLAIRVGTNEQQPAFGSFVGSGALDQQGKAFLDFGVISREESHPLMLERDRYYANLKMSATQLSFGDQTWSTSYLTESGHYGFGGGARFDGHHLFGGAYLDTGRRDLRELRQAAGFAGVQFGPARISTQYLRRFDEIGRVPVAELGSVRLDLRVPGGITGNFEGGRGRSAAGDANALLGELQHASRFATLYARRVRADAAYPVRDKTALIDGYGVSLRPFGALQLEGTYDGTEQLPDETLPLDAPTRQRVSRAGIAWGSLVNVQVNRREWTSPGANWGAGWLREYASAQLGIPLGPIRLTPTAQRGYEASPVFRETPFSRDSLRIGVRLSRRSNVYVRGEYGQGIAGDAGRTIRRISFGGTLQPTGGTKLTFQLHDSATDAPWLEGTQWANAVLDQRLPWGHHAVATYRRRSSGSRFLPSDEAYRLDYVVPVGIPLKQKGNIGGVRLRVRDGDTGAPRRNFLVQLAGASVLTDASGVADFQGLTPGNYFVTVAPGSVGAGRALVPEMPLKVSVSAGRRTDVQTEIVRTSTITGVLQQFNTSSGGLTSDPTRQVLVAGLPLARAVIDLAGPGTHRTALTDERGRFEFASVPPGDWRIIVSQVALPPFYQLEQREVAISVSAGRNADVVLRAVPKSQSVGADVSLDNSKVAPR